MVVLRINKIFHYYHTVIVCAMQVDKFDFLCTFLQFGMYLI